MWNEEVTLEEKNRIDYTNLAVIVKIADKLKEAYPEKKLEEIIIPFEFIIGSMFPQAYQNIKNTITQSYIEGFNKGREHD